MNLSTNPSFLAPPRIFTCNTSLGASFLPLCRGRPSERLFNPPDFRIVAAPFAQTSLSILLDTHVREGQDDLEVSPFPARLPLRRPRAVSFTVKLRIERQEGSSSSARFSPLPRGLTFCPTYCATRPRPEWFQAQYSSSTRFMRGPFLYFSKRRTSHV